MGKRESFLPHCGQLPLYFCRISSGGFSSAPSYNTCWHPWQMTRWGKRLTLNWQKIKGHVPYLLVPNSAISWAFFCSWCKKYETIRLDKSTLDFKKTTSNLFFSMLKNALRGIQLSNYNWALKQAKIAFLKRKKAQRADLFPNYSSEGWEHLCRSLAHKQFIVLVHYTNR